MKWNNGLESARFEKEQEALAKKYRAFGMTEEQIQSMYEYDKAEFNCRRVAAEHEQEIPEFEEGGEEGRSPLQRKNSDATSTTDEYFRNDASWLDNLDDPRLDGILQILTDDDRQRLTLHFVFDFTYEEIGEMFGVSPQAVAKTVKKIKKFVNRV